MRFPSLVASLGALASPYTAVAETLPLSETIVVTGRSEETESDASFETRHRLDLSSVAVLDAGSADEILRQLPSVHVPVNSRGEAIAFLRNAGERQVAIFFDGAAINVPWDNRLDLALIPAPLLGGGVRTAAGPLAPHYGVNALGAVSLSPGTRLAGRLATGTGGLVQVEGAVPFGPLRLGASRTSRRALSVPKAADLPFSQAECCLRTNTDRSLGSLFAQLSDSVGKHDLSLTAFRVWGEKGIAPEGHLATGARFWRYPEIRHTLVVANARSAFGPTIELATTLWHQRFGQVIDSYSGADYRTVEARQIDRDRSWGVREILEHDAGKAKFVGSANLLHSVHGQIDIEDRAAQLPAGLTYSQRSWSLGGEVEYAFSDALVGELGLGYDRVEYLRTGDKPPIGDARGWTGRIGIIRDLGGGWRLRAAAGRKIRAATMRELFGQAIGRFLPNPDLGPERITTLELGAEWDGRKGSLFLIPFVQEVEDTIDQRKVGALRQRINLAGSTVHGFELGGEWRPAGPFALSGNATWTRVRRKDAAPGTVDRIAEKPALLARVRADLALPSGLSATLEAELVDGAWSPDDSGTLVPLGHSAALDFRIGRRVHMGSGHEAEIYLRADNLTDTLIVPQLGLPAPGRTIRIGLTIE